MALLKVEVVGPTPARRVSWTPGAEGAPMECEVRWEWVVVWPDWGTIRRDCWRLDGCLNDIPSAAASKRQQLLRQPRKEMEREAYHDDRFDV